jgi:hypothetical protein
MPKPVNYNKFFSTYLAQDIPDKHTGEARLDCPFLDCPNPERHFYANCSDGTWHCKRCDKSGNARTLITMLHAQALLNTTGQHYLFLSEIRGVSAQVFDRAKWAYDEVHDRWLVPYFTYDPETGSYSKFLNNLGYFYPSSLNEDTRFKIKKAGSLPLYLYNPGILPDGKKPKSLVLCEGEWDTLAYMDADPDCEALVLGKPGSGFNKSYLATLKNIKTVITLLDNDASGLAQTAQCKTILADQTSDIRTLNWDLIEDAPKDIRDLWIDISSRLGGHDPRVARSNFRTKLLEAIVTPDDISPEQEPKTGYQTNVNDYQPVTTFQEYVSIISQFLYTTPDTIAAMASVFGITNSITIPGEPLWAFLIGPPSCLDENTIVKVNRASKSFDISLRDLHYMYHGGKRSGKVWNSNIPTTIQRRDNNGFVRLVTVTNVIHSGKKLCYEVTTESGESVIASADHKFLTEEGWKRLKNLSTSDSLFVLDEVKGGRSNGPKSKNQRYKFGLTYHPYATQPCQGTRKKSRGRDRVLLHRLVYEAYMNDMSLDRYIYTLKHSPDKSALLKYLSPEDVIHHIDEDHNNNCLSNLQLVDKAAHGKLHGHSNSTNFAQATKASRIVSIVEVGVRDTYDISVANDPHNFLANGIVVHNSGKTTFIDSFGGNNKLFDNLSKISAKSLVSGWKDETGEEPSYLAKLRDKTLFVKDFTVTLTDSLESQKEVFGLLTDIFDGYVKIPYGNNQVREFYDLYFNMIAGVTDIVHSHSAASIGERFLRIDFLGRNYESREFARRALLNFGKAKTQKDHLMRATLGFVRHLRSLPIRMEIQDEYIDPITDLAEFIATIRTKVESDSKEGIKYRPRTELPARLASQLAKLFVSTRCVYTTDPNSEEDFDRASKLAFETVKKVALDTCYGFSLDLVRTIFKHPYINRASLADKAKIHPQRAYRVLTDLCTTGVLTATSGPVGSAGGRPADYFTINPKLHKVLSSEDIDISLNNQQHAKSNHSTKRPGPKRPPSRPRP